MTVLPLCINCATLLQGVDYPHSMPCVGCGRELRHRYGHHFSHSFCSEACEDVVLARRERRRERRERRRQGVFCACCGVLFRPKRRGDAITCSPACRQKLYRARVTDRPV